jgi:2'-5' RNA ligase
MASLRAFVALELPPEIQQALRQISADLKAKLKGLPLRWVAVENIHLTLNFLGDIPEDNIKAIADLLSAKTKSVPPFEIELGGLGVFPNPRRPNVVWVGVSAPDTLNDLQKLLETELSRLGFPAEERSFSPHLTLARVRRAARPADLQRIGEIVTSVSVAAAAAGCIESVALFRSDLKPSGAVYNALFRSPLL